MNRSEILDEILRAPWVLADYQNWLDQKPVKADDDYLYSQSRIRFAPADQDQLIIPESLALVTVGTEKAIRISEHATPIRVPALRKAHLESLFTTLRGQPLLIELPLAAGVPVAVCDQLLQIGFGRFIYAPSTVEDLETRARAAEIVRFPGSPYEIVRNYWVNVGQLTAHALKTLDQPSDAASFVRWLRELHVRLLLGEDFATFYCPSSPIAEIRVAPGALYTRSTQTVATSRGRFIVSGPRVNASAVGGPRYQDLLWQSLKAVTPTVSEHKILDQGACWGTLIAARARSEELDREWFLPPRPMNAANWESLWQSWAAAVRAAEGKHKLDCISQLGRFHWYFVHLHPFSCANQSLAFALVNCLLNQINGCGIPQLVLDHCALRLNYPDYVRVFRRAVAAWSTSEFTPLARHKDRMQKRQMLDSFVTQLNKSKTEHDAISISDHNSEAARLALLVDD